MNSAADNLLSDFIENFEKEIKFKEKVNLSEESQLNKISELFESFFKDIKLDISPIKKVSGVNPSIFIDFEEKLNDEKLISLVQSFFKKNSISFKKNKFLSCYPIFSAKNNTVPGLLDGRGFFMITLVSKNPQHKLGIKIECLRDNQVIRILDSKLENLTIVLWNGSSMSRSSFCLPGEISLDEEFLTEDGLYDFELVSKNNKSKMKVRGNFYLSETQGLILEKITSVGRG
jgi:hypothetical protein